VALRAFLAAWRSAFWAVRFGAIGPWLEWDRIRMMGDFLQLELQSAPNHIDFVNPDDDLVTQSESIPCSKSL
jgi:hypothetical protein